MRTPLKHLHANPNRRRGGWRTTSQSITDQLKVNGGNLLSLWSYVNKVFGSERTYGPETTMSSGVLGLPSGPTERRE